MTSFHPATDAEAAAVDAPLLPLLPLGDAILGDAHSGDATTGGACVGGVCALPAPSDR